MPKKIRVYELARELGLTNKEALDLCIGLGIGVKSHSSSIEDQQADRVRRKADREGLRREVQPDEDEPAAKKVGQAPAAEERAGPLPAEPGPSSPRAESPRLVTSRAAPVDAPAAAPGPPSAALQRPQSAPTAAPLRPQTTPAASPRPA
ncbi:MAG: translation initiation factor IF-2 N-terminal domain-containing protein, partial [Actinomycetota bacterium]|nr:translation initiation factor IF-2 N-terminal domain-containing protein [Actinomycetota bacterium]